jgi:hypothetical protein
MNKTGARRWVTVDQSDFFPIRKHDYIHKDEMIVAAKIPTNKSVCFFLLISYFANRWNTLVATSKVSVMAPMNVV